MTYSEYSQTNIKSDVVFLISKEDDVSERVGVSDGFLIILGKENKFRKKIKEVLCYETTEENLFNTVFTCFIIGPLSKIFTGTIENLSNDIKKTYKESIESLLSTSLRVIPKPESLTVEVGKSVQLSFDADIEGYQFKKDEFIFDYNPRGIIKCNGMRIEGIKAGKATLYVYREGENKPSAELNYTCILRNRISEIELQNKSVFIGVGDTYQLDYTFFPADADNTDKIIWESEQENVVQTDNNGYIRGVMEGDSTVRIMAENISDSCVIHVLPHISDIIVDDSEIVMLPGESIHISAKPSPAICIDAKLKYACMDVRVANIIGTELKAVDYGETFLVVQNREETITKKIKVCVRPKEEPKKGAKKKRGLFSKIFG